MPLAPYETLQGIPTFPQAMDQTFSNFYHYLCVPFLEIHPHGITW